jgi:hypothetical protein
MRSLAFRLFLLPMLLLLLPLGAYPDQASGARRAFLLLAVNATHNSWVASFPPVMSMNPPQGRCRCGRSAPASGPACDC